jgi:hypothetical protein
LYWQPSCWQPFCVDTEFVSADRFSEVHKLIPP